MASTENLERQRSRLARRADALAHLAQWGLSEATITRFGLGLKAPYRPRGEGPVIEDALSFPVLGADARPLARFAFLNLDGLTANPPHPIGWGVGSPLSYWSSLASPVTPLIVAPDMATTWLLAQLLEGEQLPPVVLTRSHGRELPLEWLNAAFWARWPSVIILSDPSSIDEHGDTIRDVAGLAVMRLACADAACWRDVLRDGMSAADFRMRLAAAVPWRTSSETEADPEQEGDFACSPVKIANAFRDGQLFYPFLVEERKLQSATGRSGERRTLTVGYAVRVLRSDGAIMKVITLPSPRGASESCRVHALSDGTRIDGEPAVSRYASWSFDSISRFIRVRREGKGRAHRPLSLLASDIEAYLRACVWLPNPDDYALATSYVLLSYVFPVFDAIPLLLVVGSKGTGKTELGQCIADLSCNGVVVGQASAAGLVRLMQEARGLIVLDDLERIGASAGAGFSEIAQMLKLSYKRNSASKPVADRVGSVTILDFFGPKCITNTRGADDVLGSRMLRILTAPMPGDLEPGRILGPDGARASQLRDELHCWGMAAAAEVAAAYRRRTFRSGRREEIEAPLRSIAVLVGTDFTRRLESALANGAIERTSPHPSERLRRALAASGAAGSVTIQQLQLELALADAAADPLSPETVGRLLSSGGYRAAEGETVRVRLNGILCRVVTLDGPAAPRGITPRPPLQFCQATPCGECRYAAVCATTIPELRAGKRDLRSPRR